MSKKPPTEQEVRENLAELENHGNTDDAVVRIREAWDELTAAKAERESLLKQLKEKRSASEAALRTAMEEGCGSTAAEVKGKLQSIEVAWQDLDETLAGEKEERKVIRERVSAANDALRTAIIESRQLPLFPS